MVSMWVNASVIVGQWTVATAAVLGLALLTSSEQHSPKELESESHVVYQPVYNVTACTAQGDFLATLTSGSLAQGFSGHAGGVVSLNTEGHANRMAFCPLTQTVAIGSECGKVSLADRRFPELLTALDCVEGGIISISLTDDGRFLCAGDSLGQFHVWTLPDGKRRSFPIGEAGFAVHAQTFGHEHLAVVKSTASTVEFWDLQTGEVVSRCDTGLGRLFAFQVFQAGHRILAAGATGTSYDVRLINADTGAIEWSYALNELGLEVCLPICVSLDREFSRVVLACGPYLQTLEAQTGRVLESRTLPGARFSSISPIPDSDDVLTASYAGQVSRWSLSALSPKWTITSELAFAANRAE